MIYVLTGISLLFLLIGYSVTENNAKYLLAGYNTMSEEERSKFNLSSFLYFFKKFHLFLGISYFIFGLLLHYLINPDASGIFIGTYTVLAYLYFVLHTRKFHQGRQPKAQLASIFVVLGAFILVGSIFGIGYKENEISLNSSKINISGIYGEVLNSSEIESITLIEKLPVITFKTNGFASGTVHKGYFQTNTGENIKLLLNSNNRPYILITKKTGNKIYFSAKKKSNEKIFAELRKALPTIALN